MSTQTLVTHLKQKVAPGHDRVAILEYVDDALQEIFNWDSHQTTFLQEGDPYFPVPFLKTTAEKLNYTPSESNLVDSEGNAISLEFNGYPIEIRRIKYIYKQVSSIGQSYNNVFMGKTLDWAGVNEYWVTRVNSICFERVTLAGKFDKSGARDASIVFAEDPDTTTDRYYCEFYYKPMTLSSESIPMPIDDVRWKQAFRRAVRGYMEEDSHGRSELLDGPASSFSFRNYWIPQIRSSLNEGMEDRKPLEFPMRDVL